MQVRSISMITMTNMINRQILALVAAVLAAVLVAPSLGRDAPSERPSADAATKPTTRPENHRQLRLRNDGDEPRIFEEERFTDDKAEEVMAFVKKNFPEEYKRLEALRKEDPAQARQSLRRLWRIYQRVRHLPPEIQAAAVAEHRLNVAIFRLRGELLQTEDAAKKAELTQKLRDLLGEQFDNDQTVKEYKVKLLDEQLAKLKAEIEQRKTGRQKIINERMERLMKPGPDIMQPPGPSTRPSPPAPPRERNVEKDN